jgi:hypothetical protein
VLQRPVICKKTVASILQEYAVCCRQRLKNMLIYKATVQENLSQFLAEKDSMNTYGRVKLLLHAFLN